jgi:hypothetical protein
MPSGYAARDAELLIECPPGGSARAEFVLMRQHREMRMLPPLAVRRGSDAEADDDAVSGASAGNHRQ